MVLLAPLGLIPGTEPLRHDKASTEEGNMLQCVARMVTHVHLAWIDDGMYVHTIHVSVCVCMVLLASLGLIPGTEPLRHDKASTEEGDMLQKLACC